MHSLSLTFVAVLSLSLSCAHVAPVTSCLESKVGDQAPAIIIEVKSDIQQKNWDDLLLGLGPKLGWDVLACALDELESNQNATVSDRAKSFKRLHAEKLHGAS